MEKYVLEKESHFNKSKTQDFSERSNKGCLKNGSEEAINCWSPLKDNTPNVFYEDTISSNTFTKIVCSLESDFIISNEVEVAYQDQVGPAGILVYPPIVLAPSTGLSNGPLNRKLDLLNKGPSENSSQGPDKADLDSLSRGIIDNIAIPKAGLSKNVLEINNSIRKAKGGYLG